MGFAGFSIEIGKIAPQKNYGFSIEDNSNLLINLVDDQTGDPVEADITVNVGGTDVDLTGDSKYGLLVDAANINITVAESTHLAKVVAEFAHDGSEFMIVTIELRKIYYYRVRAVKNGQNSDWSNVVKLASA